MSEYQEALSRLHRSLNGCNIEPMSDEALNEFNAAVTQAKALLARGEPVEPAAAEKARELFIHKKSGNLYEVHGVMVDCTNSRDGTLVVLYGKAGEPARYVRHASEFADKFDRSTPAATGEMK